MKSNIDIVGLELSKWKMLRTHFMLVSLIFVPQIPMNWKIVNNQTLSNIDWLINVL